MEFVTKMQSAFRAVDGMVITDDPNTLYSDPSVHLNAKEVINGFNSMDVFMPWTNDDSPDSDISFMNAISNVIPDAVCYLYLC